MLNNVPHTTQVLSFALGFAAAWILVERTLGAVRLLT